MKSKILKIVLIAGFLPILLLGFMLFTKPGVRAVIHVAGKLIPGTLKVETVQGSLAGNLVLSDISFMDDATSVSIEQLSLAWNPLFLLKKECMIQALDIEGVGIQLTGSDSTVNDPAASQLELESISLPLAVQIKTASVNKINFRTSEQPVPIMIDTLQLQNIKADEEQIQFGLLKLTAKEYQVQLNGRVHAGASPTADISGLFSFNFDGYSEIAGQGSFSGTFENAEIGVRFEKPFQGNLHGNIVNLITKARWQAELLAENTLLSDISSDWPELSFSQFSAEGNGTFSEYSVRIKTITAYDQIKNVHLTTLLEGDAEGLAFEDTTFAVQDGRISGNGKLDWKESFSWQADLSGSDIMLIDVDPAWPGVDIQTANLSGHGVLSTYSITVDGDVQYKDLQEIKITTDISGDETGMQFTDIQLLMPTGNIVGTSKINWKDDFGWQANLIASHFNTAAINSQWPSSLDMEMNTSGSYSGATLSGILDIVSTKGELRGYPLDARGTFSVDDSNVSVNNFFMQTNGTLITASGDIGDAMDMRFHVDSPELASLWPDLSGQLKASGSVTGKKSQPAFDIDIEGSALSLGENSIGIINGTLVGNSIPGGKIESSVQADNLLVAGRKIESVMVTVSGKVENHLLQAEMKGDDGQLKIVIDGGLSENNWAGVINTADIEAGRFGTWLLPKPGSILLSAEDSSVFNLCLLEKESSKVCIKGNYNHPGQWKATADLHSFPLARLGMTFPGLATSPTFSDNVTGTLSMAGTKNELVNGELNLAADNLSVQFMLGDNTQKSVSWKKNRLNIIFQDGRLSGFLDSVLQDGSFLNAHVNVDDFVPTRFDPEKIIVQGGITLNIFELNSLSFLTLPMAEPYGAMNGKFTLTGPVSHPDVEGHAAVENGKIIIPSLGITLKDILLRVTGDKEQLDLGLSCSSGEGILQVDGTLAMEEDRKESVTLTLSGDRFEVLRLPEWRLKVAPELQLFMTRDQGKLSGSLVLLEGMLAPHNFASSVSPSPDVIIADAEGDRKNVEWPFSADVTAIVEDSVAVNAFGLKGNLSGKLKIEDRPGKPVIGTGNLSVNKGKFSIYGRDLDITTGKLLFSGGAIDNPGIAVRAENTTQRIKTGIAVSGFLQEPEITFYSDPPMTDNEIISRLLMNTSLVSSKDDDGLIDSVASDTGLDTLSKTVLDVKETLRVDDIKVESGKSSEDLSLVIGTWLTPSLYVSYGKNLLKESGSFNTKYLLGKGFYLETESGTTESGVDLMFEIDR